MTSNMYHVANEYNCPGCTLSTTDIYIRVTDPTVLPSGYWYNNGNGFVYQIVSTTSSTSWDYDFDGLTGYLTCSIACSS
jgi:hypothetical protein